MKILIAVLVAVFTVSAADAAQARLKNDNGDSTMCMAEAMKYEGGNQPHKGKLGIAEVIMTRARSGKYPKTICGVVHQKVRGFYQFSYMHRRDRRKPEPSFISLASEAIAGKHPSYIGRRMYFNTALPRRKRVDYIKIGDHFFW